MINEEEDLTPGEEIIKEDTKPSQSYIGFVKALSNIGTISAGEAKQEITNILSNVEPTIAEEMLEKAKLISDEVSSKISECSTITESKNGAKKSIKELIGEIFPSLSFYPALGIWSMVDKMVSSGKGFDALTPEQTRLLPVYMAIFFGLVGGKIAYNRLKDSVKTNDAIDKEINETLKLAGIELNESVESNLDDAKAFVTNELQAKFGAAIPENDEEKGYVDDLINMATMKYNVPEDSLRNALGLVEEEPIEEPKEPTEEVPGEKIEEV